MLTFSIVTPTLNASRFVSEAMDSILSQQYAALEYWVMDGGSTDDTLQILEGYTNRLRWITWDGLGQSAAINHGWQQTKGEIISWLNADDVLLPGAIARVAAYFESHPEVDIVYGDCDYIDPGGGFIRPYPTRAFSYLNLVRNAFNYLPQPAVFMRRGVLTRVGLLDESLHYAMDFDYWLRAGLSCNLAHVPDRLAAMRLHPDAKSIAGLPKFAPELVIAYQKLYNISDLPHAVENVKFRAMSNIYYRACDCAYWGGDLKEARRYARTAWCWAPLNLRRQLWLALLGRPARTVLLQLRGNPHTRWSRPHE